MEKAGGSIQPLLIEVASGNVQQGKGDLVPEVVPIAVRERDGGDAMPGEIARVEGRRAVAWASAAVADEVPVLPAETDEDPQPGADVPKRGVWADDRSRRHHSTRVPEPMTCAVKSASKIRAMSAAVEVATPCETQPGW